MYRGRPAVPPAYRTLDEDSAAAISAIAAVVLAGALPASAAARQDALREVVGAFDRAVSGLGPAVRKEIADLLALLCFAPTRMVLAGVSEPWFQAPSASIEGFLASWRQSRFDLLRAGYQALVQLINAAWYGNASAWPRTGYAGPPNITGSPPA
jgi:hypothetical protein